MNTNTSSGLQTIISCLMLLMMTCAPASAKSIEKGVLDKLPARSEKLDGYDNPDSVVSRLVEMPLHAIEGLWRFASEGTLMAIERSNDSNHSGFEAGTTVYRMVIVCAADMALRPGTVMGYLSPTAKRGVYDGRIYTSRLDNGTSLHSPKTFTVTLSDGESRIAISSYGSSLRFNWWRLLPYMYRYIFTRREKSPGEIHGCLKVFPEPAIPSEPRYL